MIIENDSFFKNPPTQFNPELVVVMNAIRYSVEICEISYIRLTGAMSKITDAKDESVRDYEFPSIFSDAWSIINNAVIFKNIIFEHFEIPKDHILFKELNKAVDLRHTNQHIDQRIAEILAKKDFPVFGTLTWLKTEPKFNKATICTLYSGSFTNKVIPRVTISNARDDNDSNPIQKIELSAIIRERTTKNEYKFYESKIHLSKIMYDIHDIINTIEKDMVIEFSEIRHSEKHLSDLIIRLKGHHI